MSTSVAEFENQTPISAKGDDLGPTYTKSEITKRGLEDKEVKPRKKPRTK
jgi:hypothetical protein